MNERCFNHPDKKSLAPCHSCKKYFCEECLTEGREYYYCGDEQCQALKNQEDQRFEGSAKRDTALLQQKWKENGRRFYKKTSKILGIAWVLLTVFLFIMVPSYNLKNPSWLPLISLIVCLKWFVLSWFVRVTVYRHFIWKRRMMLEVQENQP
jgi:hypothetical protein